MKLRRLGRGGNRGGIFMETESGGMESELAARGGVGSSGFRAAAVAAVGTR